MIKCFTFENFKSFERAELNIDELTTLIGANASGKSNAIEGIAILSMLMSGVELNTILDGTKSIGAVVRGGSHGCARFRTSSFKLGCLIGLDADRDLYYEIKIGVNGRAVVNEEGVYIVRANTTGSSKDRVFKTKAVVKDRIEIKVQYKNGKVGNDPTTICVRTSAILPQILGKIIRDSEEEREIAHMLEMVMISLRDICILDPIPAEIRNYARVSDTELRTNCDNLSAVLNKMCKNKTYKDKLLEIIRKLPENMIADIEFIETRIGDVIFALCEEGAVYHETVDARQLSDGTLRCIAAITAALISKQGSVIVIEEIDNGIHPSRVYKLIEQLLCIGKERRIDFVITTHNATLLNAYKKEELVGVSVVYREKEKRTSKIISFVDIENFPSMLIGGGLGNAMIDDSLISAVKKEKQAKDYSWLGV